MSAFAAVGVAGPEGVRKTRGAPGFRIGRKGFAKCTTGTVVAETLVIHWTVRACDLFQPENGLAAAAEIATVAAQYILSARSSELASETAARLSDPDVALGLLAEMVEAGLLTAEPGPPVLADSRASHELASASCAGFTLDDPGSYEMILMASLDD